MTISPTIPSIQEVLGSPSTSHWLKASLEKALARDPVDAVNDATLLFMLLDEHQRTVFERTREVSL